MGGRRYINHAGTRTIGIHCWLLRLLVHGRECGLTIAVQLPQLVTSELMRGRKLFRCAQDQEQDQKDFARADTGDTGRHVLHLAFCHASALRTPKISPLPTPICTMPATNLMSSPGGYSLSSTESIGSTHSASFDPDHDLAYSESATCLSKTLPQSTSLFWS